MVRPHRIFAALYDRQQRPLERGWLGQRRAVLLGDLAGQVLEVGAGTGGNLAHYRHASEVVACEPDPAIAAAGFVIGPLEAFEPRPNSPITRPVVQGAATRPTTDRTR
jgi:SAM-dependent methyltransferase